MEEENPSTSSTQIKKEKCKCNCHATGGGIYGLAFVGALIFYLQHATTFWIGALGVLKALVWPAVLVYKLLQLIYP